VRGLDPETEADVVAGEHLGRASRAWAAVWERFVEAPGSYGDIAGLLRCITWKTDRGKDPETFRPKADYPWFWGCSDDVPIDARTDFIGRAELDGNRWNDLHYTNAKKREARTRASRRGDA
jgi:hypothetical protein